MHQFRPRRWRRLAAHLFNRLGGAAFDVHQKLAAGHDLVARRESVEDLNLVVVAADADMNVAGYEMPRLHWIGDEGQRARACVDDGLARRDYRVGQWVRLDLHL